MSGISEEISVNWMKMIMQENGDDVMFLGMNKKRIFLSKTPENEHDNSI